MGNWYTWKDEETEIIFEANEGGLFATEPGATREIPISEAHHRRVAAELLRLQLEANYPTVTKRG